MNRRSKRWLSLWLIVAVLGHFGLGHRDASAFVLCLGAHGHVAVEPAGHDHGPQARDSLEQAPLTGKDAHVLKTGPCTDIPVISEDHGSHKPLIESKNPSPDTDVLPLRAFVIALIPFDELAAARIFFPDPSIIDSRLPTLRSVVLLI